MRASSPDPRTGVGKQLCTARQDLCVDAVAVLIYLFDGGAGDHIVELAEEKPFPPVGQRLCGIFRAEQSLGHKGCRFRILIREFAFAVVFLVLGLRGIGPPVILEVKLAYPSWQTAVSFYLFFKPFHEISDESMSLP